MGTFPTNDRNGAQANFQVYPFGSTGNIAGASIIVDPASGAAANIAPNGIALQTSSDGTTATYRAGAVAQTLYSAAAAALVEIKGSATRTVRIKKITLWAQAGTKFFAELTLLRCTAVSASGSPVVAAIGKHAFSDPTATAVVNSYAAAALAGAGAAVMGAGVLSIAPPASGMAAIEKTWDFSRSQDKAIILVGIADVLQVFNNTVTLGTGTFGFETEFEEI
jgi:hypothetical protein